MKPFLLIVIVVLAACRAQVQAITVPHFEPIRSEITNQLAIANRAPVPDKKLIAALTRSASLISRVNETNFVTGTKTLVVLVQTLNRTSLSNQLFHFYGYTFDQYFIELYAARRALLDRLEGTFPSGAHTAALANIDQARAAIFAADATVELETQATFLNLTAKKLAVAAALTKKAEATRAPVVHLTARVAGSLTFSFASKEAVITPGANSFFTVTSEKNTAKPLLDRTIALGFKLPDLGNSFVTLDGTAAEGGATVTVLVNGVSFVFNATDGVANITRTANRVFGTFSFAAQQPGFPDETITVTGEFNGSY